MIWWRGRGLYIPFLIALPVLGATANHGSTFKVAVGLLVAALLVYLMRDWLGEHSAVYSIPVRIWPPVLIGLAILTLGAAIGENSHPRAPRAPVTGQPASATVAKAAVPAAPTASTPTAQTEALPAQPESGVAAFESWARRDLAAGAFRYVSNDEIWISLLRKPDQPATAAQDAAARYKRLMARSTPIKLVLFSNNNRVAESTQ